MIVLFVILVLIIALAAVLIKNTLDFKPEKEAPVQTVEEVFDGDKAVRDLQALVRCKTVSYRDKSLEDDAEFAKLEALLPQLFPNVYAACTLVKPNGRSLLFHWKGKSAAAPGVLMAHYDVVPVNEEMWEKPAFEGIIENDLLWGRGTLDTKATFLGVLEAADNLIAQGFIPANDLYLAFGGDEEISGTGAPAIVAWFKQQGIIPAFVLDEGGAVVEKVFPGVKQPCALIGIGEKGPMDVRLTLNTNGGHSSTPPPHTPVGALAKAVVNIERRPFPFTITPPAAQMFDILGRRSTFLYRMIFANLWFFSPILNLFCRLSGGELNALVRTTVAFTQMEGSAASNVLPPHAWVGANLRLISGETVESAQKRLQKLAHNKRIKVEVAMGMDPSPISRTDDEPYQRLQTAIRATWPTAVVSPYLMLACSDSRHYAAISDHVYRFSAMALTKEERGMIHSNNERIPLSTIRTTIAFYQRLIRSC